MECDEVIRMPRCPGELAIGDYVFATRWWDACWSDPWCVGFVGERGKNFVTLTEKDGGMIENVGIRAFPYAMKITAEQGERIVREYPPLEGKPFDAEIARRILFGEHGE